MLRIATTTAVAKASFFIASSKESRDREPILKVRLRAMAIFGYSYALYSIGVTNFLLRTRKDIRWPTELSILAPRKKTSGCFRAGMQWRVLNALCSRLTTH
jgi:hypothetical protein